MSQKEVRIEKLAPTDKQAEIKIEGAAVAKIVPAAPSSQVRPPQPPLSIGNPMLLTRAAPIPTACAQCGATVHRTPSSTPFKGGPHHGGFMCPECWILEWADHPEIAADAPTRQWFAEEAARIRTRRAGGAEVLYRDGQNKAYLTKRGTVLVDLAKLPFGSPDEYDPDRFRTLIRLFRAVASKVDGYEMPDPDPIPEPPKPPASEARD
jgi:hypothetical protein